MQVTSRFTIAIHTLLCIGCYQDKRKVTADFIAGSINTNPVIIRRLMGQLKEAELVTVRAGVGGTFMAKPLTDITLLDIFLAIDAMDSNLFNFHTNPNNLCPVGRNIHTILDDHLLQIQNAMYDQMKKTTLQDLLDETIHYLND